MLTEKQLKRYADVLLWGLQTAKSRLIARNDIVLIRFDLAAVRLAEILFARLLEAGAHPLMRLNPTAAMERDFYSLANSKQLIHIPPGEENLFARLNGSISIFAPESMTHLAKMDPQKIARSVLSKKKMRDVLDKREAQKKFSWTLCMFPTGELAKHARISQKAYCAQVARACFLNSASPVIEWQNIFKQAQRIKRWLNRLPVTALQVISENVDLHISLGEKRRWVGISGRNIPSFEIFVSPDWRGTQGRFYADQPSYRSGNYVRDVRFKFENGRLVKIAAKKGRAFVRQQLAMDKGAARIGEFSLTDKRFSRINRFMANTLYDENYGGTNGNCHIALGSSYSNTYAGKPVELTPPMKRKLGFNESALHWDFVNTEKKQVIAILKSGKKVLIYENGKFTH
ncbi:MAG: aminopeptidase [Deltaproteobacteria bacterium]|nr:aminopeptidase [Deltaproteobacteria bacterium]